MEATTTITQQSATIAELAKALAKAQAVMEGAAKDKKNPHFGNTYADLASVWSACRKPLTDNGLAVVQSLKTGPDGVTVFSTLLHSSGEWKTSECWLPVVQKTPQGYGSTITYARRYSLAALVGVAQEDDDGNAGSNTQTSAQGQRAAPRAQAAKKAVAEVEAKPEQKPKPVDESAESKVRAARVSALWKKAKAEGVTPDQWRQWQEMVLNARKSPAEMTDADVDLLESAYPTLIADPEKAGVIAKEDGKDIPF